jgi:GT2 family glycosyltransferase
MTQIPAPDTRSENSPQVSVIIVNWNTRQLLADCIRSIREQTVARHEVIVVDNCSTDGSPTMVRTDFPDVVLIENRDNRGFAAANNQGLAVATGEYLLLLNPDTVVLDGAIDKMLAWLAAHPGVGCVGCQVLEGPDVIQRTCFADPGPVNQTIVELGLMRLGGPFGRPWYADWDRKTEREVDVVSGMFMLMPRDVFLRVGPLDDGFFIYAEEADWCRRIRKAGFTCVFAPVAQIVHLDGGSKSTAQIKSRMFVQKQKSHIYYVRKHDGAAAALAVRAMFVTSAALRFALFGVMRMFRGDDTTKARMRLSRAALAYHLLGREPAR